MPALAITYVASGGALLVLRTAPFGVVLLAPVIVMIFLTELLVDAAWAWGALHAAVLVALAWNLRAACRPLWNHAVAADARNAHGP